MRIKITAFWLVAPCRMWNLQHTSSEKKIIPAGSTETCRLSKQRHTGSPSLSLRMYACLISVWMPIKLSFQLWPRSEKVTHFFNKYLQTCVWTSRTYESLNMTRRESVAPKSFIRNWNIHCTLKMYFICWRYSIGLNKSLRKCHSCVYFLTF